MLLFSGIDSSLVLVSNHSDESNPNLARAGPRAVHLNTVLIRSIAQRKQPSFYFTYKAHRVYEFLGPVV